MRGGQGTPLGHALGDVLLNAAHVTFQVGFCAVQFVPQAHDLLHTRQIHAEFLCQPPDFAQVFDVTLAVKPRLATGSSGPDQLFSLVQAQGLGVHVHQFRRDGNHVHGAVFRVAGCAGGGQFTRLTLLAQLVLDAGDLGLELALKVVQFVLQTHDLLHACQIHAEFLREPADFAQVLDVAFAVQARFAGAAAWTDQSLTLVQSQGLGVHVHQFRRDGDHVHGTMFGVRRHNFIEYTGSRVDEPQM